MPLGDCAGGENRNQLGNILGQDARIDRDQEIDGIGYRHSRCSSATPRLSDQARFSRVAGEDTHGDRINAFHVSQGGYQIAQKRHDLSFIGDYFV
jgi:hypothetical protein